MSASVGAAVAARRDTALTPEHPPAEGFIGQKFGSFRVVRELGRGGMGTVWLAEHALIQKRVAVKVLHAHMVQDRRLVNRFLSEARTLTLIQHENVVALYDLDIARGAPLPRHGVPGGAEPGHLRQGALEPAVMVDLLSQVCDALGAAHAHGVVHRDLSPPMSSWCRRGGRQRVKLWTSASPSS